MNFLLSLLSGDESEVDSVIVCGVVALVAICIIPAIVVLGLDPAAFNPGSYAGSAASLIGTVAAGKTARDRWSQGQPGGK